LEWVLSAGSYDWEAHWVLLGQNVVDEDMVQELLRIRAKFKVITAIAGLREKLVYSEDDIKAHKDMSF
jgi:hypothetical protein